MPNAHKNNWDQTTLKSYLLNSVYKAQWERPKAFLDVCRFCSCPYQILIFSTHLSHMVPSCDGYWHQAHYMPSKSTRQKPWSLMKGRSKQASALGNFSVWPSHAIISKAPVVSFCGLVFPVFYCCYRRETSKSLCGRRMLTTPSCLPGVCEHQRMRKWAASPPWKVNLEM